MTEPAFTSEGAASERRGRRRALASVAIVAVFVGALAAAALVGAGGRKMLAGRTVKHCASAEEFLSEWRKAGVRGRVLVLLARDNGMSPDPGPTSGRNVTFRALQEGIVRRILHVIPDQEWESVDSVLRGRGVVVADGVFRLEVAGAPLLVLPRSRLAPSRERVLVALDADRWSPEALSQIVDALLGGVLDGDLVLWTGSLEAGRALERLAHVGK